MLEDILLSDNVVENINNNLDYLTLLIPEIKDMIGFEHKNKYHNLDVWEHTLKAISISNKDIDVRLTLLLHDIGKPHSYQEDGEFRHYKNHNVVSSNMSKIILKRLCYNNEYIEKICYLMIMHDIMITEDDIKNNYELEYIRYQIQLADGLAHNQKNIDKRIKVLEKTKKLFKK